MKVSVLIVNWNGKHLLPECLAALRNQSQAPHQVIVVDNGSTDGSVAYLEQLRWDNLETVFLENNEGFSGGNNAGFAHVTGDLLALLNNDARPKPDWIRAAVQTFDADDIGMVACKILRAGDVGRIDKAGHVIYLDGQNRGRGTGHLDGPAFNVQEEVLWPDGCAGFYRMTMLKEIGLFDDRFFLYAEDAELGMRARWAGWRCMYQPRSVALHRHSASLGKFAPRKIYYVERNRIWLAVKTFPLGLLFLAPFFSILRFGMAFISLLLGRGAAAGFQREHSFFAIPRVLLEAWWDALKGLPAMIARRRRIRRRISTRDMYRLLWKNRISASELSLMD